MADLENVINISVNEEGSAVVGDNMNVVAIFTSEQTKLSTDNRYEVYYTSSSVDADFGTESDAATFARSFFGTSPNPASSDGMLVMGYWRAAEETIAATAAALTGEQLSEEVIVPDIQQITDGSFTFSIDGVEQDVTAVDLSSVSDFDDALVILNASVTGATFTLVDNKFILTSDTTGVTSLITHFTTGATGTFIGNLLGLSETSEAVTVQGADSYDEAAETKLEALAAVSALIKFKGFMFVSNPTDAESIDIASWCQANDVLGYDVFDQSTNLEKTSTNPVWQIKLAGNTNYRMLYSKAGNRKLAASYMARTHVVLFNGENTAMTMNLKELSVSAEYYTQSEITKASYVGLDIYTTFGNNDVSKTLTSGANGFTDNRYNMISYTDTLKVGVFNLLGSTGTKIAQNQAGVDKIVQRCEKITEIYTRSGVFSPGTWTSSDTFGNLDAFNRNIELKGYYFLSGSLADQTTADRQARKSPVIQGAVKNAGAIHSVDVIINFNL